MPSNITTSISENTAERVMVFIDGSNLYHVLDQNCSRHDVQFDKFAKKLANGRSVRRIYYYNIRQESDRNDGRVDQDRFLHSLYDTPYVEVRLGIAKQRRDHVVEKGVDVMLATDLVVRAYQDQYDTAILVSGDGDFYPAIQAVKDRGKQVEVAAFDSNISAEAARVADLHVKLNETFFTGLWMTRTRASAIAKSALKPEVRDEVSSPNGEDKSARTPRQQPSAARRRAAPTRTVADRKPLRRTTPARRRVSGSTAPSTNGSTPDRGNRQRSRMEPAGVGAGENKGKRTGPRRNSWLKRLGLVSSED
jgi:uncharacterized LabA/DUF88 family protein